MSDPGTITRAVNAVGVHSVDAVFPRVYEEMRKLAAGRLAQERRDGRGGGLEPTVLVHAAYEKLFGTGNPGWESRRHFFGAATNAMRQILIDQARKRKSRREVLLGPHPATALVFGFSEWGPTNSWPWMKRSATWKRWTRGCRRSCVCGSLRIGRWNRPRNWWGCP